MAGLLRGGLLFFRLSKRVGCTESGTGEVVLEIQKYRLAIPLWKNKQRIENFETHLQIDCTDLRDQSGRLRDPEAT